MGYKLTGKGDCVMTWPNANPMGYNQFRKPAPPRDPGDLGGMTDRDLGALRNWLAASEDLKPSRELRLRDIRDEIISRGHTVAMVLSDAPVEDADGEGVG